MDSSLPSPGVIDWGTALEAVGGDRELLSEVVDAFLSDAPRQFESLRSALSTSDFAAARRAAHTLKGNSRYFGARTVVEIAQRIEEQAQREDPASLDQMIALLHTSLENLLSVLADYTKCGGASHVDHLDRG